VEQMFAALVANVHTQLAGHVAVRCAISRHRWESVPDLLAGGLGALKLNPVFIARKGTVVNVPYLAFFTGSSIVAFVHS
jgi:hypothetical protein